ncbi:membrane-spanning 4-domains subfamily A member 4A-like isoform X1 [Fukomys damarensis]|uniref:membrane-spanning 4-domains subfamily A member 4A-like isoform X1 n=1 Tax=Fukomys damarensis TaxID=885580 RepID=UPI00053FF06F|nr:membrane-spanning 4-domains subfamily A member 4A-like isoform X1 [Fukomys damarensis]XP_010631383.1 membrane-spanning 4-domains subfamily A member 4A-like isoform X1 [Fukomys damarensis]
MHSTPAARGRISSSIASQSAAIVTAQGMEPTSADISPAVRQLEQPAPLHSFLPRRMAEKFLKGEPKILGIVQILIAVMNFGLGTVILSIMVPVYDPHPMLFNLGYPIWGSVMFFISGSLSIAAGATTTKGMIQSSIGLNITSSVLSALGVIITAISLNILSLEHTMCHRIFMPEMCSLTFVVMMGLEGIVLILSLLELCIALSLAAFGCKVTCCNLPGVVLILQSNPHVAQTASPAPVQEGLIPLTDQRENVP